MLKNALLRILSVGCAFLIFGIMDNGIMVIAGNYIDKTIGETFHLSTLASAGLGNTLSDIIGICSGRYTEQFIHKLIPRKEMSPVKTILSEAVGITIGCLIGMTPLLILGN